jgi:DNA-binding protein YbaB
MTKQPSSAAKKAASPKTAVEPAAGRRKSQPDGRKGILVRATPAAWKELKRVAIDEERTLQDVMTEAINDVLKKYGKPPVA